MARILIIGTGFAGMWSALSARRLINLRGKDQLIEVVVVAPRPSLVLRPRLYEPNAAGMTVPLQSLFQATGVRFVQGTVEAVHTSKHTVDLVSPSGNKSTMGYDRLILAAGSRIVQPAAIAGLAEHAFDVDGIDAAEKLESHLKQLATLPPSPARDTVVVCGAGFTGIEAATELPGRLRSIFGGEATPKVVLVGNRGEVGPELGPGPRPAIIEALTSTGVDVRLGAGVSAVDAQSVTLSNGERIETLTPIWTAGVKATPLTQQIEGEKDAFGRLIVDADLRVPSCKDVFATGDAAAALADNDGHLAMMSCQHAIPLGKSSGNNAAADLLQEPTTPYTQPGYLTCLDLGGHGAVVTKGWDREIMFTGSKAKYIKSQINQKLIYPPTTAEQAFAESKPGAFDPVPYAEQMAVSA
ncbi:hypothetical protein B0I35DRAFT_438414 [Stachybotrys elegans]|uniref:FAD/NAD(P)-binding domain-containing protein n=1 Tax=Stachybotrys elegans TaxID=80388 RepID=A0A8K0SJ48_9HYPO|nr:hypothetical protein B0I35DRAFT_438414 [Stachybotrys elegans]